MLFQLRQALLRLSELFLAVGHLQFLHVHALLEGAQTLACIPDLRLDLRAPFGELPIEVGHPSVGPVHAVLRVLHSTLKLPHVAVGIIEPTADVLRERLEVGLELGDAANALFEIVEL